MPLVREGDTLLAARRSELSLLRNPLRRADNNGLLSSEGEPRLAVDAPAADANVRPTRPEARGKFVFVGDEKLYVRGVTYGTFAPDEDGRPYPPRAVVERDLARMAASGINAIRTYTVPPRWLLDAAQDEGLYVLVGIPWEQHVAFLDDHERPSSIERRVREAVGECRGHASVLGYVIGNEIPASIVRWHGARRIEKFLERLYCAVKQEDPGALVTYVNFPTTEYLRLPFLDLVCFNVYLESEELLDAYLARLQNIAGDRPLLMTELGFDSRRTNAETQALVLEWQARIAFASGCAGVFIFAWSDSWHRGGYEVDDWDFGLVDRAGAAKPALASVSNVFRDVPFRAEFDWPRISVVVCSYNGAATIGACLDGLTKIDYPNYEVIVVDDGSTDDTAAIASAFDCRLLSSPNEGLASARNRGIAASTGAIVAFIDDDAWPDPQWLTYLAAAFVTMPHAAIGGPNVPPPTDSDVAQCVARAPGAPQHVLVTDRDAEHIPGCNMAFRKAALEAIGGFDPAFRVAGDDVDICWRLHEQGWTIGFAPAAMVWHRRRASVRAYVKQQFGYGKAEALLERKWPEKYNHGGHVSWKGRVYGAAAAAAGHRWRIYYGTWGGSLFQSLYDGPRRAWSLLPLLPEAYVVFVALLALALYGAGWEPAFLEAHIAGIPWLLFVALVGTAAIPVQAAISGWQGWHAAHAPRRRHRLLTSLLYLVQPWARLLGRARNGLTPWRIHYAGRWALPRRRCETSWSEQWQSQEERLLRIEAGLRREGLRVQRGSAFDRWDVEARIGPLGGARLWAATEEHGAGKQLVRYRIVPRYSRLALILDALLLVMAATRLASGDVSVAVGIFVVAAAVAVRATAEAGTGVAAFRAAIGAQRDEREDVDAVLVARAVDAALPLTENGWHRDRLRALGATSAALEDD